MGLLSRFVPVLILLGLSPLAEAAEYYVDPAGNDAASGLFGAPWRTVDRVNRASLVAGDAVYFRAGASWSETLQPRSGAAGRPVLYSAFGLGNKPRLLGVNAYGKSHAKIHDLDLTAWSTNAVSIASSSYIVITDCNIFSNYANWAPVISIVSNSHHNQILNSKVGSVAGNNDVINLRGNADYNLIQGNTITAAGVHCAVDIEGYSGNGGTANYNIIRNNTVIGTGRAGSLFALQSNSHNALVENNVFTGDGTLQAYCFGNNYARHQGMFKLVTQNNIVRNNILKDYPCKDTNGITLEAYRYAGDGWTNNASGNRVYSNVVTRLGAGAMPLYIGENDTGGKTFDNVFKNNILFNNGGQYYSTKEDGSFPAYTLWAQMGMRTYATAGEAPTVYNNALVNNLFFSPSSQNVLWIQDSLLPVSPSPSTPLGSFQANISVAPQLDANLRPLAGSPVIGRGAPLTLTRAAGSGTSLPVQDAGYFSDGHGLIAGDTIRVGSVQARITRVDRATNTLILASSISWSAGAPVSMPHSGSAPNIGLYDVTATPPIEDPVDPPTDPDFTITASASTGGTISPSGARAVVAGSSQTFTITPASGYRIAAVLVDGASVGAVSSYTFSNVSANHSISASFAAVTVPPGLTINASASSGGTISPAGAVSVASGSSRSFAITPAAGFYTASVTVDGVVVAQNLGATSYTFSNITANHTIAANFLHSDVTLTASAGPGGSISPAGSMQVTYGTNRSFTITPAAGYAIASVLVDGVSVGAVSSYTFSNLTANHSISASFRTLVPSFTINASASSGGTISPAGAVSVTSGGSRSFAITPATGFYTASVTVDGVVVARNLGATSYTFSNVNANHSIAASFLHSDVTLTASAGAGGSISPAGSMQVTYGTSRSFTITPAAGYAIASVLVDGVSVGAVGSYTFSNLTRNHTISASFRALVVSHTINASASSGGTISPAGAVSVTSGGSRSFAITPAAGYYTDSVTVDGVVVTRNVGATSYTFSNVRANHTISARFLHVDVTLTASASAGGSISPAGTMQATYGSSRTFTITPAWGYRISSVLVDGVSVGAVSSYTFTNLTRNRSIRANFVKR